MAVDPVDPVDPVILAADAEKFGPARSEISERLKMNRL